MPTITDWIMVVITAVYVIATIFICYFNGKSASAACNQIKEAQEQLKESQHQQQQNTGIQLYQLRKDIIQKLSKEEYNEIYWDISLLFDDSIFNEFVSLTTKVQKLNMIQTYMSVFENHLKVDLGQNVFAKFQQLKADLNRPDTTVASEEELYRFCDQYTFTQYFKPDNEIKTFDYRELSKEAIQLHSFVQAKRMDLFMKMQNFIKKSIA